MVQSFDRNELILEGLAYTVMGIAIVFMILIIIMLVIKAMALLSIEKKSAPIAEETIIPQEIPAPKAVEEKADDTELIAVITAAVAAAMGRSTSGIVVRSYKNVSGEAWNMAGRRDVLENRL